MRQLFIDEISLMAQKNCLREEWDQCLGFIVMCLNTLRKCVKKNFRFPGIVWKSPINVRNAFIPFLGFKLRRKMNISSGFRFQSCVYLLNFYAVNERVQILNTHSVRSLTSCDCVILLGDFAWLQFKLTADYLESRIF